MTIKAVEFTSPVGRLVWGSLYEPNTKDFDGNPLTIKKGPDAGKPTQRFEFGVAIPKTQAHFAHEPGWGQLLWQTAHAAFPGGDQSAAMRADFSWKVTDGDSKIIPPKAKAKIPPCEREGYPGHWVVKFSSAFPPKIYDATGANVANPVPLTQEGAVIPGYFVQVVGSIAGNTGNSPGMYINHAAVGLRAYGEPILSNGVDVSGKFGGALPANASAVPVGAFAQPAAPAPASAVPAPAPAPYIPAAPPAAVAAPVAVTPAPALVGIPVAPAAPAAPLAAPAAPPAPVGRPPHKGIPIESYFAQGWTIEQLRADGYAG